MTDYIDVGGVRYEIMRNPRRLRVALGADREGRYYIAAPSCTPIHELKRIAEEHTDSFLDKLDKNHRKPAAPAYDYVDGELFYYRGKLYPLSLHNNDAMPPVALKDGALFCFDFENKEELRLHLERWYSRRLEELIRQELPPLCKMIGKGPVAVHIKDVKSLWGSCSRTGSVTFNIRLAMATPMQMKYIMIHELCHFYEMNHSARFWALVQRYCPDYKAIRAELKAAGPNYRW